ncbi:lysophospholipid acyltransferase family protein [Fulvivirga lutea]|uniref:1-acyl-sn-glycerol-3-phosphate acyltransferase n=1 Tax=Fulvivirga lutea TaxID=2810512 RepID=A0A974WJ90_9BACT|nr:lysophospholipid acyltransferase family protein [Fulvivirga lutea]QSE98227.1 1-acyl-sn-glycerol-3-phosphate acyltransferase [Fulvivirga lutea]
MLYNLLKAYITLGLNTFFKKLKVFNQENIPDSGPILFVANHQNALIDALLIVTHNRRKTYFLTRADAFKSNLAKPFLKSLKMLPVYRMRDGIATVNQNNEIFERCYDLLNNGDCLGIFPEGNHDLRRRLRPLSKGFTRVALGTVERFQTQLHIVPVGINYSDHQKFRGSVSVYFGKPIRVNDYYSGDFNSDSVKLKEAVSEKLKNLIIHIEDLEKYDERVSGLKAAGADLLNPFESNLRLKNLADSKPVARTNESGNSFIANIVSINNLFPLLFWKLVHKKIKDPVMIATYKFCIGVFIFPVFYLFQALTLTFFVNEWIGLIYLILSVFSAPLLTSRTLLK